MLLDAATEIRDQVSAGVVKQYEQQMLACGQLIENASEDELLLELSNRGRLFIHVALESDEYRYGDHPISCSLKLPEGLSDDDAKYILGMTSLGWARNLSLQDYSSEFDGLTPDVCIRAQKLGDPEKGRKLRVKPGRAARFFRKASTKSKSAKRSAVDEARELLLFALEADRNENDDVLKFHDPVIHHLSAYDGIGNILLDYRVIEIAEVPVPDVDPATSVSDRTKTVLRRFLARVEVGLCKRPRTTGSLAEIRFRRPGYHSVTVVYECKLFEDGQWLFMQPYD